MYMAVSHLFRNNRFNRGGPGESLTDPRYLQHFMIDSPGLNQTTEQMRSRHIHILNIPFNRR